ncbi:MAG: ABC transporter ATP-binding protein [Verrucomicrobia bacterium]|nr:ABC transporter ATP-binding protein [Verrucomicrobiota bacterium]
MSKSYLQIDSVRKRFGATEVLKGVSAQVRKGECLVLLGPSGCGKTTLLNLLAGGLNADAGTLACDGAILDDPVAGIHVPMRKRDFAMVFQEFSLWPHMTVAENIAFGLKLRGLNGKESNIRVQKALEQVHMQDFAKRWPGELSGGQQQRVAIARALVVRPRVLLLDEPLSALDARLRESLKEEIATLLREESITAVYVTHDQAEAFAIGHQIALMNAGCIEQIGTPEELYLRPRTRFVASFMGAANVFACSSSDSMLTLQSVLPVCPVTAVGIPIGTHCMVRREAVTVVKATQRMRAPPSINPSPTEISPVRALRAACAF